MGVELSKLHQGGDSTHFHYYGNNYIMENNIMENVHKQTAD